jgi:hypothetical protein
MSKYKHHQSHFNLRKFLLGFFILQKQWYPNFLLLCISFLVCMDLQPYRHNQFSKISRTLFDFWNNTNNSLIFWTGISCFSVILFYSTLLALTDGQKDRQRVKYTQYAWAGGTLFSGCAVVSVFCSGGKMVLVLHIPYVLRVPYSCGVVLGFFVLVGNIFGTYVLSVQYSCAVVSVIFGCGRKAN